MFDNNEKWIIEFILTVLATLFFNRWTQDFLSEYTIYQKYILVKYVVCTVITSLCKTNVEFYQMLKHFKAAAKFVKSKQIIIMNYELFTIFNIPFIFDQFHLCGWYFHSIFSFDFWKQNYTIWTLCSKKD